MARDPPSLLDDSQLRGIQLKPSSIQDAEVTIIHPQLRDLILPLERGRVLYPHDHSIQELTWTHNDEQPNGLKSSSNNGSQSRTQTLFKMGFAPNCLTASRGLFGCGGQHGELYICDLPPRASYNPLTARFHTNAPKYRPFKINITLPGRSINNSIVIPPSWPERWAKTADERHLGYIGRGSRGWDEASEDTDSLGRTVAGEWVKNKSTASVNLSHQSASTGRWKRQLTGEPTPAEDDTRVRYNASYETEDDDDYIHDGDTEVMSEDERDPLELENIISPTSPLATYPNTVPFLHAPRLPHLSSRHESSSLPSTSYRSSSSSHVLGLPDHNRQSRSARIRYGHPPVQYVTSRPSSVHAGRTASITSSTRASSLFPKSKYSRGGLSMAVPDEPLMLISNNDCSVKMFALRSVTPDSSRTGDDGGVQPSLLRNGNAPSGISTSILQHAVGSERDALSSRPLDRLGLGASSSRPSSSSVLWTRDDALASGTGGTETLRVAERQTEIFQRELERATEQLREEQENLQRDRADFERIIGMRVGDVLGSNSVLAEETSEQRRLSKVGGVKFRVATNHTSLSPDLKTMVSVGDSTEVNIFEVIDGGRDFKKVAVYNAATDAGFSTSWSKDGRKFAVASQDGQVTVWDHRSSRPLAIFYSSPSTNRNHLSTRSDPSLSPSFLNDVSLNHQHREIEPEPEPEMVDWGGEWHTVGPNGMVLRDPVTGNPRTGSSTSGREAARVVKFSPEGSSRDLMVFSEENSNIHIIDAQTFNTHVLLPVPHTTKGDIGGKKRTGIKNGVDGISGIAFDPTGDFLYSGTERTVVQWDLRREGCDHVYGEGGTWAMA